MPYINTQDNTQLFYVDGGSGKPIVFVASAWLSSRMWEHQLPFFARQGFRCIAYDRRGHGRSDMPWNGYDYDTLAEDLSDLLGHLDLHDVTMVGHSMGCGEIVRFLSKHGDKRVSRIVLAAGTTPFPMKTTNNPNGVDRSWMEADLEVRTADRAKWYSDQADTFFGSGLPGINVSPEQKQFMIQQCLECSARAASEFFITGFTSDLRDDLRRITVPALVIHGAHDAQAPLAICGARTAELLEAGTSLVYDDAAHGLFLTHANRFNQDILEFIRTSASPTVPDAA